MPRGDGTGPVGQGPLTGRGAGRCAGNQSGYGYGFFGRGFGRGFGLGRGFGFGQANAPAGTPYQATSEKSWLDNVIGILKNQLDAYEKRRNELKDE